MHPAVSHGRFFAYEVFRLKRGSKAALLVQVYITFAITGLQVIHAAGEDAFIGMRCNSSFCKPLPSLLKS